jgi:hypothetical protein
MKRYKDKFYSSSLSRYNKRITVESNYIRSHKVLLTTSIPIRPFSKTPIRPLSKTPIRKGDPLGTTVLAFGSPYASSLLSTPFGVAFIVLIGMGTCLYFVTESFSGFILQNPQTVLFMPRLENIILLYENFLGQLRHIISILSTDLSNLGPELLASLYLLVKELVTIIECAFISLNDFISLPVIQSLPGINMNRIHDILQELRSHGNTVMMLARQIETRLDIPEQERIPHF